MNGQPQGQVLSRDASRELDALIAEKVMDWTWRTYWRPEEARALFPPPCEGSYAMGDAYPEYSTDIAAAWLVVEKLESGGYCVHVENFPPSTPAAYRWRAHVETAELSIGYGDADSAPLAICRAALAAMEAV